ncbi:cytochrome P450 [Streptomyces sp. NPDC093225]|uniref:cytochrome P450 family protein n=1 Tax=Streptomyces sp. NPDC093225 TaxID=3366034 RepID=UPI00380E971D
MDLSRPVLTLDPYADPVEEARALRSHGCPVVPVRLPGKPEVAAWAAVDHQAAREVLRRHEDLTKDPSAWPAFTAGEIPDSWPLLPVIAGGGFLHEDGEAHRRHRGLVTAAFKRMSVAELRPEIERIADELLDSLAARPDGAIDLRAAFAAPLPIRVICSVLGVPTDSLTGLKAAFEQLVTPPEHDDAIPAAQAEIARVLGRLIADKRTNPGPDLTTRLIQACEEGERLTEAELVQTVFLLMIAGHETTINVVASAIHRLAEQPAVLAAVRAGEVGWDAVVAETLRHDPSVRYALMRYATRQVEIGGVTIEQGDPVIVATLAAGRDPEVHERPDDFDPSRPTAAAHVAFGHGVHHCVGSALAQQEAAIALERFFARFDVRLAAQPERIPSIPIHGPQALPAHLAARTPGHQHA